jgi:peptide/nickel transport system substrate-binding protein
LTEIERWLVVKRLVKLMAVLLALSLVAAACGGGDDDEGAEGTVAEEEIESGGTLKLAMLGDVSAAFDPQKEYYSVTWEFYRCCLLRTLVSYPALPGEEGNTLVPDLATEEPTVSEDGLTYTFSIREGVMYAPPFQDTEIVADDFIRALERTANPDANTGGYGFYYSVIEGFDDFAGGKADSISGLTAVDDHTLEITLTEETGDFPYRMAMAMTAPIPEGAADGHDRNYGRFLIASGPYMFEGSEDLDPQGDPVAGYKPGRSITLVRNPSWSSEVDDIRPAYVDRIEVSIGGTEEDLQTQIDSGELDMTFDGVPPPQTVRQYQTDPELKDRVQIYPSDGVRYISFNLAEPPFDDVHVRKAFNWALDKDSMRRIRGGPSTGEIAGHIIVDALLANQLVDYDPYATENSAGDIEKAKEEMAQSAYDSDGDGVCDDPVCNNITAATDEADPYPDQAALISDTMSELGLSFDVQSYERTTMYDQCLDPANHTAICLAPAWGKDYSDATTFAEPLFGDTAIGPDSCCNRALLGASPDLLREFDYEVTEVPSIDDKIDECTPLEGQERIDCWAEMDQMLMEDVVPWAPYLFDANVDILSDNIDNYVFDQFAGLAALDKMSLKGGGTE